MFNRAIEDADATRKFIDKLTRQEAGKTTLGYETRTQRRARERHEAKEARRQAKQEAK